MSETKRLTNANLAEIKKRAEAATEGPWSYVFSHGIEVRSESESGVWAEIVSEDSGVVKYSDATFIAHARQDVPALLAEVERLQRIVLDRERSFEEALGAAENYDMYLQEIDTHLRSTPEPIPHIFKTMRQYLDYREGDSDD